MPVTPPPILERLRGVQPKGNGWLAFCPAHPDRHKRSLSVAVAPDGATLLHCFVGCVTERVCAAVDMTLADLAAPCANGHPPKRREAATYDYHDERGTLLYQVVRFEPKDFRPRRPDGNGGWTWDLKGTRRVVYRLPELAEQRRVFLVEGEKDADRLWSIGIPATTTPSGASAWRADYAEQIRAAVAEEVILCPDHDEPGRRYARHAGVALARPGVTVRLLELPGLGSVRDKHGPDVSDWLDAGHAPDELLTLAAAAPLFTEPSAPANAATEATPTEATPEMQVEGDDYVIAWPGPDGARIRLTSLREDSTGLHGEVTVTRRGVVLSWGRLNLVSTSAREGLVKKLEKVAGDQAWRSTLEHLCFQAAARFRRGAPVVELRAQRSEAPRLLVDPLLPLNETAVIFGDGGAGKSYLALAVALAIAHGLTLPGGIRPTMRCPVFILDWEGCQDELEERLALLAPGFGLPSVAGVHYRPMNRALADDIATLRAEITRLGVGAVIVDSLAPAAGSEPETADAAIRVMNALRTLPTSNLVVAHVNRHTAEQRQGTGRPFGSVFVWNLARSVWEVRRSDEDDGDVITVGLYHRKVNRGRLHPPISLRLTFEPGLVSIGAAQLAERGDLIARTSLTDRIRAALAPGALTTAELAEHLDASEATLRTLLPRLQRRGVVLPLPDTKPKKWGLAAGA